MKRILSPACRTASFAVLLVLKSAAPAAEPTTKADADWAAFDATAKQRYPAQEITAQGAEAVANWQRAHQQQVIEQGLAFARAYPKHARRGEVVSELVQETMAKPAAERSKLGLDALIAETLADSTLATRSREMIMLFDGYASMGGLSILDDGTERPVDLAVARAKLDAFAALFPNSGNSELLEKQYGDRLIRFRPASVPAHVEWLTQSGHSRWAAVAKSLQAKYEVGLKPLDWKFTAFDGRAIDLAQLRGKVVLVDLWGTWCGPCVAELPHIRAVYEKYRAQGFEVVGIACERDGGARLKTFMAEQKLPWIIHLDTGRAAVREGRESYELKFGINAFPTIWLVNKEGVVVQRNVRGEVALEKAVRRELGLDAAPSKKG